MILVLLDKYADLPLGIYIVRGDNIGMLGETIDPAGDCQNLKRVTPEELAELAATVEDDTSAKVNWDFDG